MNISFLVQSSRPSIIVFHLSFSLALILSLGRFSLLVAMSVECCVSCVVPLHSFFSERLLPLSWGGYVAMAVGVGDR